MSKQQRRKNLETPALPISVKEARKILGQAGANLTNDDIEAIIRDSQPMLKLLVKQFLVRNSDVVK